MKARMRAYGVSVIKAVGKIPHTFESRDVLRQFLRCSCSPGANYRAAQRAQSTADMIAKLKIVEEELDESLHWMESMVEAEIAPKEILKPLYAEGNELLAITVASIKSLRNRRARTVAEAATSYGSQRSDVFDD